MVSFSWTTRALIHLLQETHGAFHDADFVMRVPLGGIQRLISNTVSVGAGKVVGNYLRVVISYFGAKSFAHTRYFCLPENLAKFSWLGADVIR